MLPNNLQKYLEQRHAAYVIEPRIALKTASSGADAQPWARAVAMEDERGVVIAVVPSERLLDVNAVQRTLGRTLYPLADARAQALFADCEEAEWPPFAQAYGLQSIVDVSLYSQLAVRFSPGRGRLRLRMLVQEFQRILGDVRLGRFSVPMRAPEADGGRPIPVAGPEPSFAQRIDDAIRDCKGLPALPECATKLFELMGDADAGPHELAEIVELDGAMAAGILRCANSAFYGYRGRIGDVRQAIVRVLGFDMALGLAVGMSIGRGFRLPIEGVLGLTAYRRNAVYCAVLAQRLAERLPDACGVRPGTAYAAGLLHDFGRLFMGHVFPHEYALLECHRLANTHAPMPDIERRLLGVSHEEAGADLLQRWGLPDALVCAVRHHHDPGYRGEHAACAQLVMITTRALARYGLGANETDVLPADVLGDLGLTEAVVRDAAATLWQDRADVEVLTQLVG